MKTAKQIKTEYKELVIPAGVWSITNSLTGKKFIGTSINLNAAWNRHKFQLQGNMHANKQLQQDWNTLGEQSFSFQVLTQIIPKDDPLFDIKTELKDTETLHREELLSSGVELY